MYRMFFLTRASLAVAFIGITQLAIAGGASSGGSLIAGPKDALVSIEEFADFECPYCLRGSNTMKEILKNYPGKVNLRFRNMPLPMHAHSTVAARAFTAVYFQSPSLAYSFQRELFDNQAQLVKNGEPYLYEVAERLGVNVTKMKSDMQGEEVTKVLSDDKLAAEAHGFKGAPSFMIGSEPVTGAWPYEEIKKIVDKQLGL